jgi:hypothetical protein
MHSPGRIPFLVVALAVLVTGCRMIGVGILSAAAAVGLAGYAVYKTGDAVVTGVGKAGGAIVAGTKSVATVVYADGDLKVEHPADLRTLWAAADRALRQAGFTDVKGSCDALSGDLTATSREQGAITLRLRSVTATATELRIRVGAKGDLKMSELINGLILQELPSGQPAAAAGAAQEDKP